MKTAKNKDFIVIGQFDSNDVQVFRAQAKDIDVACHSMEIKNGWGTFIACDKHQARKIIKSIKKIFKEAEFGGHSTNYRLAARTIQQPA